MTHPAFGTLLTAHIDRPLGSTHPNYPDLVYPVNYGYIPGLFAPDGEEQDVYVLGVTEPLETFTGALAAVIHRKDDVEDKWVLAPAGTALSREDILAQTAFQERYFQTELRMEETSIENQEEQGETL
ncbi:MAG: inorganic pyrophosphatase [Clostridiales bacterium]|nr:inorganic pyrophosphatase [Clostridiales bacterium]